MFLRHLWAFLYQSFIGKQKLGEAIKKKPKTLLLLGLFVLSVFLNVRMYSQTNAYRLYAKKKAAEIVELKKEKDDLVKHNRELMGLVTRIAMEKIGLDANGVKKVVSEPKQNMIQAEESKTRRSLRTKPPSNTPNKTNQPQRLVNKPTKPSKPKQATTTHHPPKPHTQQPTHHTPSKKYPKPSQTTETYNRKKGLIKEFEGY